MENVSFIIDDAVAAVIRSPLLTPFRIATGQHDRLENVFLRIRTADGICGYGEAAVATHITGETVAATLANLNAAAALLRGRRVDDVEEVCRGFRPHFMGNHAGLAALEMALLDICARLQGLPFYKLFQPISEEGPRLSFATDITIVIGTLDEAKAAARQFAGQGFTTFKIKIGRDGELDLRRILAVRQIAPDCGLILDANMGFDAEGMLAFLGRLDGYGAMPLLLEQPVAKQDWEGLARITTALSGSGTLVCADESVGSLADAKRAIDNGAVSAINVKFMKSGILEGAEIARLASSNGMPLMMGAMMESALAITAAAHFAGGLGCIDFADLDTTFFIRGELAHSPCLDSRGRFDLHQAGPGIGVVPQFPH